MIYVVPEAVLPLVPRELPGGWTLFDARMVDVLRGPAGPVRLPRQEAERLASGLTALPGAPVPPAPPEGMA